MKRWLRWSLVFLTLALIVTLASARRLQRRADGQVEQATPPGDPRLAHAQQAFDSRDYSLALNEFIAIAEAGDCSDAELALIDQRIAAARQMIAAGAQSSTAETAPARVPHAAVVAGEVRRLGIKELGNFDFDADQGGTIPDDVKALSGHPVELHGYIAAFDQSGNVTRFTLAPTLSFCCFGRPPQLQHTVQVHCAKGQTMPYLSGEVIVKGVLTVAETRSDGFVTGLFDLSAASVKPIQ